MRLVGMLRLTRERMQAAERDVARIASENARLVTENAVLKAKLASSNTVEFAGGSRTQVKQRMPFDYITEMEK
jgi:regulator of replication initiation timing